MSQDLWQQTNGPYRGGAVQCLAIDSGGYVYAGTRDGGVFRSEDKGENWMQLNGALPDDIQYLAIYNGYVFAGTYGFGVFRSSDKGESWRRINNGLTDSFVSALVITVNGHVFAGTYFAGIFLSLDYGENWRPVNNGLTRPDVLCLAVNANGHIFAGMGRDGIFRSTNNGNSWEKLNTGFAYYYAVKDLAIDASGHVFAALDGGGGFYRSQDNGENWKRVDFRSLECLAINSDGYILGGSLAGVVGYNDNDGSWKELNAGLSDRYVLSLAIDANDQVYAGTLHGGVFRSTQPVTATKEVTGSMPTSFSLDQNFPNPFKSGTTIAFSMKHSSYVTLKAYDLLGKEVASLLAENLSTGKYTVRWNAGDFASGIYLFRLQVGDLV